MKKAVALLLSLMMLLMTGMVSAEGNDNWICPNCKVVCNNAFCGDCATPRDQKLTCPSCGYVPTDRYTTFCPSCGKPMAEQPQATEAPAAAANDTATIALLTSGRWIHSDGKGQFFLDFYPNFTGKASAAIDFAWTLQDDCVEVYYIFEGKKLEQPQIVRIKNDGLQTQLVMETQDPVMVLTLGQQAPLYDVMRKWVCVSDDTLTLDMDVYHNFTPIAGNNVYTGTWSLYENNTLKFSIQGKSLAGLYMVNALQMQIGDKMFTFEKY